MHMASPTTYSSVWVPEESTLVNVMPGGFAETLLAASNKQNPASRVAKKWFSKFLVFSSLSPFSCGHCSWKRELQGSDSE
jgi:hypothetical protein